MIDCGGLDFVPSLLPQHARNMRSNS